MRKIVVQIIFSVFCLSAQAQKVTNIRAEQHGQEIVVLYSLETTSPCEVSSLLSQDNGFTWSAPLMYVSGDVGKNISAGEKKILWKVLEEREQLVGDKVKFKIKVPKVIDKVVLTNREYRKQYHDGEFPGQGILVLGSFFGLMWLLTKYGVLK